MKTNILLPLLLSLAITAGCASSISGRSYSRYETRTAYDVAYGEVVSTRIVEIEGENSFIGVFGGAELGRAIGSTVSDDRDTRRVTRAAGGIAGAVAGRAVERKLTEEEGLEITVRLDDSNDIIAVVQAQDVEFAAGERVRVLFGPGGSARVSQL